MKNYKLPFTDRFGNALHESDWFKYTSHKDLSIPDFTGQIIWIEKKAAFGYRSLDKNCKLEIPFSYFTHPQNDFLRHIERIEPNNNLI